MKQSLKTFRGVLKDNGFGELWVSGLKPNHYQHVFASTQTLNSSAQYTKLQSTHFDVVVFDETHHIQAKSYQSLVEYFEPKVLLGLTATPERMDGKSILPDFNDRIAYEIRLNQAIEQNLLCPFHYFGITDDVDLSQVRFQSGQYDTEELGQIFIKDYHRDRGIIEAVDRYVSDLEKTKGLGFCVNQDHAKHMASVFERAGIPSESLDANSNKATRDTIQGRLKSGKIKFIFVVDLYNEGIDLPYVNTVLFLRPTKSATIFIWIGYTKLDRFLKVI
jgi:superfamily II DNA or RNA helicase